MVSSRELGEFFTTRRGFCSNDSVETQVRQLFLAEAESLLPSLSFLFLNMMGRDPRVCFALMAPTIRHRVREDLLSIFVIHPISRPPDWHSVGTRALIRSLHAAFCGQRSLARGNSQYRGRSISLSERWYPTITYSYSRDNEHAFLCPSVYLLTLFSKLRRVFQTQFAGSPSINPSLSLSN